MLRMMRMMRSTGKNDDVENNDVEEEEDNDVDKLRRMTDPRPGPTLRASLCSRNALGHFKRAILSLNS